MDSTTQILTSNPNLPNDSKLLDGWVADVSQMTPAQVQALAGTTVKTETSVAEPTLMGSLQGTYKVIQTFGEPNGSGNGYFGVELQTTDANGNPVYVLVNRQFRLTTGSASDIATDVENVAADEVGITTTATDAAKAAAVTVAGEAAGAGGSVVFIGQSEGGMFAQTEQAWLQSTDLTTNFTLPTSMSLTINAVPTDSVIAGMNGVTPAQVNGLNISAVDDMFTGPHSISQNTTGTQLYVSQDSNGTFQASTTSSGSLLSAVIDNIDAIASGSPDPHFLSYFGTGNTGSTANGGQNADLNALVSANLPSLTSAPSQKTNDNVTIDQSTTNSVVFTDKTTGDEYLIGQNSNGSVGGDVVAATASGTYTVQGLIAGAPLFTLAGVNSQPTIDATTGNIAVSTAAGTYHIDPATGDITDSGAVTATIGGETVTLLGLGGTTPFALISNDNSSVTASAVSSNELTEQDVAERLGKSKRWVQQWLLDDTRRPDGPRGQFHHYVGASKRWTEESYQALRAAILSSSAEKRRVGSNAVRSTASGGSTVRFGSRTGLSDLEKVLAFPLTARSTKRKPQERR